MMSMGTSRYTRAQLADEFDKLKVTGGVSGQGASFQTTRPTSRRRSASASRMSCASLLPASEFEQLKKLMITTIEAQLSDPRCAGFEALGQRFNTYPKGDPRYSYTLQEQLDGIKAVTLDDVKRYYKTFYAANTRAVLGGRVISTRPRCAKAIRGGLRRLAQQHAVQAHHPRVPRHRRQRTSPSRHPTRRTPCCWRAPT